MLAWKLALLSKEIPPLAVPDKPTNKPVSPAMFFDLLKFKQGRRCEPKNVNQCTKKNDKG